MQILMKAIVQMGVFMICAQVLIHLRPNGSYEKYMKLLVSVMITAQIFFPVLNLFAKGEPDMEQRLAWFEDRLEESMQQAGKMAGEADALLNQKTMEQLREQLAATGADGGNKASEDGGELSENEAVVENEPIQVDRIEVVIGETDTSTEGEEQ